MKTAVFACACLLSLASILACSGNADVLTAENHDAGAPVDSGARDAGSQNEVASALDALFTDAELAGAFAGTVVVVDQGRKILEKGYGLAVPRGTRANASDSIFRVGSISKQFTAAAILKLAAQGKLAVTDPLSKYFPEYPQENLIKDGVEVTLHHLLSHTSGLPNPADVPEISEQMWLNPIDPQVQVNAVLHTPLRAKPGSTFAYLNHNFLLLGLVVERVSGQSYEAFLTKELFIPAGMTDTGTLLPAAKSERASVGSSTATTTGKLYVLADKKTFTDRDVTLAFGAGQIYSTAADLALWDRALVGTAALPSAQKNLLFAPNLDNYGYGWVIESVKGVPIEWHNGALSPLGFASYMIRVPSRDRFIAYLSNFDIDRIQGFEAKVEAIAVR